MFWHFFDEKNQETPYQLSFHLIQLLGNNIHNLLNDKPVVRKI